LEPLDVKHICSGKLSIAALSQTLPERFMLQTLRFKKKTRFDDFFSILVSFWSGPPGRTGWFSAIDRVAGFPARGGEL
jgi:hypothetical protein